MTTNNHSQITLSIISLIGVFCLFSTQTLAKTHIHTDKNAGKVTICHFPPGNRANVQTITISRNAWESHEQLHDDLMGDCGVEIDLGCFAEDFIFYGMNDDTDKIEVYNLTTGTVSDLTPDITFPDEIENLTAGQGKNYYGVQSFNESDIVKEKGQPVKKSWIYEITLEQNNDGSFSGGYQQIGEINSVDYGSDKYPEFDTIELIKNFFVTADNASQTWVAFDMNGNIKDFKSFRTDLPYRETKIEGMAYDPDKKILYATQVRSSRKDRTHILAMNLDGVSIGNMVEVDKGSVRPRNVDSLLFRDGKLYGYSDPDNYFFEIEQDANGNVTGEVDVPGWNADMSSDVEGLANAYITTGCPVTTPTAVSDPASNHGKSGRFNEKDMMQ